MRVHTAPTRLLATAAAAGLLVVGLSACGGDDSSSGDATTTSGEGGAEEYVVVAKGVAYQNDLTLEPGEEFTLDNQDTTTHTLTSDDAGLFDSKEVAGGDESAPMTPPDEPGTYKFHCEIHSSMHGTITVQ